MPATPLTVRRSFEVACCGLFCLALALLMAGRALDWAAPFEPTRENRNPADFPTLQTRSAGPLSWPRKQSLVEFPKQFGKADEHQCTQDHAPDASGPAEDDDRQSGDRDQDRET